MARTHELYKVKDSTDTAEVNRVLQRIADALDGLKGLRGPTDLVGGCTITGNVTITGTLTVKGTVEAGGNETT